MMMVHYLKQKNLTFAAFATSMFLQPSFAFAQECDRTSSNLAELTLEIDCEVSSIPMLFSSASYVMGVGFTIAGLMKMKEYVDDPSRAFMKDALIRLGVGSMLILLPSAIIISMETFGGSPAAEDFGRQSLEVF